LALYWFAFDIGRYESKTAHLSMIQDGAYGRLLRHYYKTGAPIPLDNDQIIRICGAHSQEEISAVSLVLKAFFLERTDGWHNKTADEELAKAKRISKMRQQSAKRRWDDKARNLLGVCSSKRGSKKLDNNNNNNNKPKEQNQGASAFHLPDWIPQESWNHFSEMRRRLRKPMTDRAAALIVTELYKLKSRGFDPSLVLDQSVRNSWQDVYELKGTSDGKSRGNHKAEPNAAVRRFQNNRARIEQELFGVGAAAGADGPGYAAGLGTRADKLLEAGDATVHRRGDS
jgi:uncharacterized protein YdaU (DUF1376 family)